MIRVGVRNSHAKSCKIPENLQKKLHFDFFVTLDSSHGVLSMIFGFLSKFRVGVVKNILKKIFFRDEKFFGRKSENIFRDQQNFEKKSYEKSYEKFCIGIFFENVLVSKNIFPKK